MALISTPVQMSLADSNSAPASLLRGVAAPETAVATDIQLFVGIVRFTR